VDAELQRSPFATRRRNFDFDILAAHSRGKRKRLALRQGLASVFERKWLRSNRLKGLAAIRLLRECCFSVAMAVS
jgi:hypothetical protein